MKPSELYHFDNVQQIYGGQTVLSLPELTLCAGQICALIGANGAGKSTLLSLLAFLEPPATGVITFNGEPVRSSQQRRRLRRRVVLLDQEPIMFTGSVLSNVEYGLKLRGVKRSERLRRAMEALERVGLADFARRNARRLSGGETKRVAMARALVLSPEVFLCDEPAANVDVENQEIILKIIEQVKNDGSSVFFSTHSLSHSRRLAEETLHLDQGRLSQPEQSNRFRVRLERHQGRIRCTVDAPDSSAKRFTLLLPEQCCDRPGVASGSARLEISVRGPVWGDRAVSGPVLKGPLTAVELEREEILFQVDVGVPLRFYVSRNDYCRLRPVVGEVISVVIPPAALRLSGFSAANG